MKKMLNELEKYVFENLDKLENAYMYHDCNFMTSNWKLSHWTTRIKEKLSRSIKAEMPQECKESLHGVLSTYKSINNKKITEDFTTEFEKVFKLIIENHADILKNAYLAIDHGDNPNSAHFILIDRDDFTNHLAYVDNNITFTDVWGVLDTDEFMNLYDWLDGVHLAGKEYIDRVELMFRVKSYYLLQEALKKERVASLLNHNVFPDEFLIEILKADHYEYTLFKKPPSVD